MEGNSTSQENPQRRVQCPTIKIPLLLCKIIWFLIGAGAGLYIMFRNPFLISVGISAREAGLINGVPSLVAAVLGPLWGLLADKTGARRCITIFLSICFPTVLFATPWIGSVLSTTSCKSKESLNSTNFLNSSILKARNSYNFASEACKDVGASQNTLFYAMLVAYILASSILVPIDGLFKSITMNVLEQTRTSQGVGNLMFYRFFGSGIANLLAGLFADRLNHPSLTSYGAAYLLLLPLMIPLVPITFVVFRYTKWENKTDTIDDPYLNIISNPMSDDEADIKDDENEEDIGHISSIILGEKEINADGTTENSKASASALADKQKGFKIEDQKGIQPKSLQSNDAPVDQKPLSRTQALRQILTNGDNIVLLITLLIVGILMSVTYSFLLLIIKDEMNGSKTSMGITILVDNLAGAALQFFAERVIKLLGGPIVCIELGVLSWIIRLIAISYIRNPWLVLLPQLLNSFSRGLFTVAMMRHIHQVTPIQVHSTMFILCSMLEFSLGIFLANIVGGSIYQTYKGPFLFRGTAVGGVVWFTFMLMYFHCVPALRRCLEAKSDKYDKDSGDRVISKTKTIGENGDEVATETETDLENGHQVA